MKWDWEEEEIPFLKVLIFYYRNYWKKIYKEWNEIENDNTYGEVLTCGLVGFVTKLN